MTQFVEVITRSRSKSFVDYMTPFIGIITKSYVGYMTPFILVDDSKF